MMNNTMVGTLPIKPQDKTNIGMLIAPTVMDYIGTVLNIPRTMGINTLSTYDLRDQQEEIYLDSIKNGSISYDSLFVDKKRVDELLEIVERLYHKEFLKVEYKDILRCECGKVDFLNGSLDGDLKLCEKIGDKYYCKLCHSECKSYKEKSLVLTLDSDIDDSVSITPVMLTKEMKGFAKQYKGSEILVSKNRDTGYNVAGFNIDIDFLWMNFFNLIQQENQILLASNHQLFFMYLMNYYSKLWSNKSLRFVATPYVRGDLNAAMDRYNSLDSDIYKKLFILYNLQWGRKDCNWSEKVDEFLHKKSPQEMELLYRSMIVASKNFSSNFSPDDMSRMLDRMLRGCTNMQENNAYMRQMRRNGVLW